MSKIHAVIATALVVGLSSTAAMADSRVSFHADARATVSFPNVNVRVATSNPVVVRDHRHESVQYQPVAYYPPRQVEINDRIDVSGRYNSNFGTVTLQQRGNRITGSYFQTENNVRGTIDGTIDRNGLITYSWDQGGMQRGAYVQTEGMGMWHLDRFGRLDGTFGNGQSINDGGEWDLTVR